MGIMMKTFALSVLVNVLFVLSVGLFVKQPVQDWVLVLWGIAGGPAITLVAYQAVVLWGIARGPAITRVHASAPQETLLARWKDRREGPLGVKKRDRQIPIGVV